MQKIWNIFIEISEQMEFDDSDIEFTQCVDMLEAQENAIDRGGKCEIVLRHLRINKTFSVLLKNVILFQIHFMGKMLWKGRIARLLNQRCLILLHPAHLTLPLRFLSNNL